MEMAIFGGVLIGLSVSLMLLFNGRVTGISGIVSSILSFSRGDKSWRASFILGLLSGGFILRFFYPDSFNSHSLHLYFYDYLLAGFLVGFGTLLGSGCTSGHGVCGISRLSTRSIVATLVFITFGIISVLFFRFLRGEI